jgi:hypothetical protein
MRFLFIKPKGWRFANAARPTFHVSERPGIAQGATGLGIGFAGNIVRIVIGAGPRFRICLEFRDSCFIFRQNLGHDTGNAPRPYQANANECNENQIRAERKPRVVGYRHVCKNTCDEQILNAQSSRTTNSRRIRISIQLKDSSFFRGKHLFGHLNSLSMNRRRRVA